MYSPSTILSANLHLMYVEFLKFDPIAITVVFPEVGPSLGSTSNTNGGL